MSEGEKTEVLNLCCQLSYELRTWNKEAISSIEALKTTALDTELQNDAGYQIFINDLQGHHDRAKDLLYKIQSSVAQLGGTNEESSKDDGGIYAWWDIYA